MINFIIRKSIYGLLVLAGVVVVVFFLFNILPGDPTRMMVGQHTDAKSLEAIKKDLGLDRSLSVQFGMYVNDLMPISIHNQEDTESAIFLDDEKYSYVKLFPAGSNVIVMKWPYLRRSYQTKRKVTELILDAMPETFVLAFTSILIGTFLGIILGMLAAINKGTWFDSFSLVFSVIGMSGPSFFVALIFAWVFGFILSDYTGLNMYGSLYSYDDYGNGEYLDLKNLVLPAITLGIRPLAVVVQLTRSSLLEVLSQDYIRTAKAKGLSFYSILMKHAMKNALNPVVTAISGWFAGLMAGAVLVEMIFDWKGIGYEVYQALIKMDFPVVMGAVLVIATVFVVLNVLVDISYGLLDPRVRVK